MVILPGSQAGPSWKGDLNLNRTDYLHKRGKKKDLNLSSSFSSNTVSFLIRGVNSTTHPQCHFIDRVNHTLHSPKYFLRTKGSSRHFKPNLLWSTPPQNELLILATWTEKALTNSDTPWHKHTCIISNQYTHPHTQEYDGEEENYSSLKGKFLCQHIYCPRRGAMSWIGCIRAGNRPMNEWICKLQGPPCAPARRK